MIKRSFHDKFFEVLQDFSRGACEGPRLKFSRPDKNPRNPRNFSPLKILGYIYGIRLYGNLCNHLFYFAIYIAGVMHSHVIEYS